MPRHLKLHTAFNIKPATKRKLEKYAREKFPFEKNPQRGNIGKAVSELIEKQLLIEHTTCHKFPKGVARKINLTTVLFLLI